MLQRAPADEISASLKHEFYPAFDYLRALAALGVFAAHADKYRWLPSETGNACVQIFFALSGFLIGGILLRSKPSDMPRFYFNRAARIWTPYAIFILLLFLLTALKQGLHEPKFGEFFFYMATFTYNWFGPPQLADFVHRMPLDGTGNAAWSICVEEQFYLIAPLMLLLLNRWLSVAILAALVMLNFIVPHYFASIALGVLLAMARGDRRIICLTVSISVGTFIFYPYEIWMPFVAVTIVGCLSFFRGRQTTVAQVLGGASYSFYLLHWIGLFVISAGIKLGMPFAVSACAGLATSAAISIFHYLFIDRWIADHRSIYMTRGWGIAAAATGFALVLSGAAAGEWVFHAPFQW